MNHLGLQRLFPKFVAFSCWAALGLAAIPSAQANCLTSTVQLLDSSNYCYDPSLESPIYSVCDTPAPGEEIAGSIELLCASGRLWTRLHITADLPELSITVESIRRNEATGEETVILNRFIGTGSVWYESPRFIVNNQRFYMGLAELRSFLIQPLAGKSGKPQAPAQPTSQLGGIGIYTDWVKP